MILQDVCSASSTSVAELACEPSQPIHAVNAAARRFGVKSRQTLAQARALCQDLALHALSTSEVFAALRQVADVALGYGTPVSIQAPDTVWIDISGSAHLFTNEEQLATELLEQLQSLGHVARAVVADGPWLSRALARFGRFDSSGVLSVDEANKQVWLRQLPIQALPLRPEAGVWFAKLGLLHVGQLQALPRSALASRLRQQLPSDSTQLVVGEAASTDQLHAPEKSRSKLPRRLEAVLDLIGGVDPMELIAYQPDPLPEERWFWDEPTESLEPLRFVIRGLAARIAARLQGRGQAAQHLVLTFHHDPSIFVLRGFGTPDDDPQTRIEMRLTSPLARASDLERVLMSRLTSSIDVERERAPTIGLSLCIHAMTKDHRTQLELGTMAGAVSNPQTLSVLVAELTSDVGETKVGLLVNNESLLPEKRSRLLSVEKALRKKSPRRSTSGATLRSSIGPRQHPTRLLHKPLDVGPRLRRGEIILIEQTPFVIESLDFEQRLEDVEWWSAPRIFRDYFQGWLCKLERSAHADPSGVKALLFWDRCLQRGFLHALYD